MTFGFGVRSKANLNGVHPNLVRVAVRALELTEQDFMVLDGVRTIEEQRENVARGVSRTMKSKHLPQEDGLSHALDLVPYINGQPRWEWLPTCKVADAMRAAANDLNIPIRWGGTWAKINGTEGTMAGLSSTYAVQHPGPDFLDGVHFELLPTPNEPINR